MQKEKLDLILAIGAASVFVLLLVVAALLLFRIYLKRKNKLLLEKERMSIQFEQTLLRSKLEIQEDTFTHISREIHDNIGQILSMVRINLNTLNPEHDEEKLQLMDELMEKAITDLRNLSHSLNTDYLRKSGWIKAVERLFRDLERSGKYQTFLQLEEGLPQLGEEKPIILFRMIQEIINNILKHSKASEIILHAVRKNNQVLLAIRDNGRGFDTDSVKEGTGISNLRSRSKMIGATLQVTSHPGKGTEIVIAINVENNE